MASPIPSSMEYQIPYKDNELSLSSHNGEMVRRNGIRQTPGNSRGQPCSYQSTIPVNVYFSKNVVEERAELRRRLASKGIRRSQRDYADKLSYNKNEIVDLLSNERQDWNDDVIAPVWDEEVFKVSTGDILFLWVEYGTRTPRTRTLAGQSSVVVESCFNGLSNKGRLIFFGIAAGKSDSEKDDGREDFAAHVFGTMTPRPNYGPLTLPPAVSLFMSGVGFCFRDPSTGQLMPEYSPHGQHPKKVMPFPFYLNDTNLSSIEDRVRFHVDDSIAKLEKKHESNLIALVIEILTTGSTLILEKHLTKEIRSELMIDDLHNLLWISHLLRRAEVWFTEDVPTKETQNGRKLVLIEICVVAFKVAQTFIKEYETEAEFYLNAIMHKSARVHNELKDKDADQMFDPTMQLKEVLHNKFWIESILESYLGVARSHFKQFLTDRFMGQNLSRTCPPNSSYDLGIRLHVPGGY